MKKMEYIAPEEQVVKLQLKNTVLVGSGGEGEEAPGTGDSEEL